MDCLKYKNELEHFISSWLADATRNLRFYAMGKAVFALVKEATELDNIFDIFKCQHASLEDIADARMRYHVARYGSDMNNETL